MTIKRANATNAAPVLQELSQDNASRSNSTSGSGCNPALRLDLGAPALRVDSSRAEAQILGANVSELAGRVEERVVGSDVGILRAEPAKVRVAADKALAIEPLGSLEIKVDGRAQVLIRIRKFRNPDLGTREAKELFVRGD